MREKPVRHRGEPLAAFHERRDAYNDWRLAQGRKRSTHANVREVIIESEKVINRGGGERIVQVEKPVIEYRDNPNQAARIAELEAELEAARGKADEPIPQERPVIEEDGFQWSPDFKENQDKLQKLYAELMGHREYCLSHDQKSEAMALLLRAERVLSGIRWNTAKMAEQI